MSEILVKAELSQANDREEQTAGSDNNSVASDQRAAATACRSSESAASKTEDAHLFKMHFLKIVQVLHAKVSIRVSCIFFFFMRGHQWQSWQTWCPRKKS